MPFFRLKNINLIVDKAVKDNPDSLICMYEDSGEFSTGYLFIFSKKGDIVKTAFFDQNLFNSDFSQVSRPVDGQILKHVKAGYLTASLKKISQFQTPVDFVVSHDHILYFNFRSKSRAVGYKICESQMMLYPNKEQIAYFSEIVSALRAEVK